jgi:dolichol kinase
LRKRRIGCSLAAAVLASADVLEVRDSAVELRAALSELDRGRRRARVETVGPRVDRVRTRLDAIAQRGGAQESGTGGIATAAGELAALLEDAPAEAERRRWLAFRQRVQPAYEALVHELSAEKVEVPSLRPTNYARNLLHVASAASGILVLELAPASWPVAIAGTIAALGWALEIGRRRSERVNRFCMTLFGRTAHPHEAHRINSATWYSSALLALALTGATIPCVVALAVLGLGDPAAAIVGRRLGKTPLVHGRTLEGTLAFFVAGAAAASTLVLSLHPELALGRTLFAAAAAAACGAVAELLCRRVDDNLAIPLAGFAGAFLALG